MTRGLPPRPVFFVCWRQNGEIGVELPSNFNAALVLREGTGREADTYRREMKYGGEKEIRDQFALFFFLENELWGRKQAEPLDEEWMRREHR